VRRKPGTTFRAPSSEWTRRRSELGAGNSVWTGLSDNYVRAFLPSPAPLRNNLGTVRAVAEHPDGLWVEEAPRE